MPKMQTLQDTFIDELRDLLDAEKQLVRALPKMAKAASSEELTAAFKEHLEQTKGQVQRLEQVFALFGQKARSKPCKAMKGLVEEGQEIMEQESTENLLDLALIGAAQKVEHYEIAGYGTLRTFAQAMGNKEAAQLLDQTLKEEEATDKKLTQIAKTLYKAAQRDEKSVAGETVKSARPSSSRGSTSSRGPVEPEDVEEEVEA
jgi:ferritin-like metal-binding protein YciE